MGTRFFSFIVNRRKKLNSLVNITMKLLIPFAFSGLILAAPVPNVFESEGLDGECEQDIVNAAPAFVDQPSLLLDLNIDTGNEDYTEISDEPIGFNEDCQNEEDPVEPNEEPDPIILPAFPEPEIVVQPENLTEETTCEYDETTAEPVKTEPPVIVTDPPNNLKVETDPPEASGACEGEEDDDDTDVIGDDEIERDNEEVFDNIGEYAKRAILDQDIKLDFGVNNLETEEECVEDDY